MAVIKVKLNIKPLEKFQRQFKQQMRAKSFNSTIGSMFKNILFGVEGDSEGADRKRYELSPEQELKVLLENG